MFYVRNQQDTTIPGYKQTAVVEVAVDVVVVVAILPYAWAAYTKRGLTRQCMLKTSFEKCTFALNPELVNSTLWIPSLMKYVFQATCIDIFRHTSHELLNTSREELGVLQHFRCVHGVNWAKRTDLSKFFECAYDLERRLSLPSSPCNSPLPCECCARWSGAFHRWFCLQRRNMPRHTAASTSDCMTLVL